MYTNRGGQQIQATVFSWAGGTTPSSTPLCYLMNLYSNAGRRVTPANFLNDSVYIMVASSFSANLTMVPQIIWVSIADSTLRILKRGTSSTASDIHSYGGSACQCYDSYILIVHVCGTRKIPVRILSHFVPMTTISTTVECVEQVEPDLILRLRRLRLSQKHVVSFDHNQQSIPLDVRIMSFDAQGFTRTNKLCAREAKSTDPKDSDSEALKESAEVLLKSTQTLKPM
ncbi:hypothetical protein BDR07DRAFT_1378509 [Suillus spraguei]|nr:hypothetical protein BDR07DRAFT_1378509 [Suillus spraguei]